MAVPVMARWCPETNLQGLRNSLATKNQLGASEHLLILNTRALQNVPVGERWSGG